MPEFGTGDVGICQGPLRASSGQSQIRVDKRCLLFRPPEADIAHGPPTAEGGEGLQKSWVQDLFG
jgi:hypothetical protein